MIKTQYFKWNSVLLFLILLTATIFASDFQDYNVSSFDSTKMSIEIIDNHNSKNRLTKVFHSTANSLLQNPLSVKVIYSDGKPIKGAPVYFSILSTPQKSVGTSLSQDTVLTNENGIAKSIVMIGSKKGDYEFSARIKNYSGKNDIAFFKAYARESNWVFYLVSGLIGGLALFLFGMEMMSEGLKKTAGSKMRNILSTITNNRFVAVGVGAFVTMIIQSSSATTVMLVSFVQAQLMTFAQSLGIILGASIGTTITAQLIAFKLTDYSLLIVGIGFLLVFI